MILTPPTGLLSRADAIQAALARMQPAGSGFNTSLMSVANGMYYAAIGEAEGLELALQQASALRVPEGRFWEVERAFEKVYRSSGDSYSRNGSHHGSAVCGYTDHHLHAIAELNRIPKAVERVEALSKAGMMDRLGEQSRVDLRPFNSWRTIRQVYPDRKTLLCVGTTQDNGRVVLRDSYLGLSQCQFIVPNPMTAYAGRNQKGELSCRSLDNTGPRRFLVVECDFSRYDRSGVKKTVWYDTVGRLAEIGCSPQDMCASVIVELSEIGIHPFPKLVMVVSSGGKSLHAWFYVAGLSDAELWDFIKLAVSLGADPVTWTRCQWVRMPGGTRPGGEGESPRRQPVIYFDPTVMG